MQIQSLGTRLQDLAYPAPGNTAATTANAGTATGSVPLAASASTDAALSAATADTPTTSGQLLQAIQQLNYLVGAGHDLNFTLAIDASTHQTIVSVTDASTGALIRQLPPAQALAIASNQNVSPGALLTQQA